MKLLLILSSVVLLNAKSLNVKEMEYGFCGELTMNGQEFDINSDVEGAPQPGTIDELTVLPDPLELHTGASITISATLTLNEVVQTGSQVELSIKKNFLGIDVPIPCLEIEGNHVGSWYETKE